MAPGANAASTNGGIWPYTDNTPVTAKHGKYIEEEGNYREKRKIMNEREGEERENTLSFAMRDYA